jgi:hypothetical protein
MESRLTIRFRLVIVLLTATVVTATACDVGPVEPPGRRPIGLVSGGGGPLATTTIEGTWQRTLVFFDEFGFLHTSETTWTFQTGGGAQRSVVTANVTLGAADTLLSLARWRVSGTTVIIDFTTPSPGSITLEFRVQGTTLFLAGQEYQRAS